jgi:phosphoglycerate dehydrogenase-like enzyme
MTMRVAVLDDIHAAWDATEGMRRLREHADVTVFTSPGQDPAVLRRFDALIANRERTRFTRELLQSLSGVRVIAQTGNHASHIDFAAARELGITVAKASGGYSVGTAELTIGLAIAVMRQVPAGDAAIRRGEWPSGVAPILHGKTLGIVGLGRLGRHVARLAAAFGMRLLAWSPTLTPARAAESGAEHRELDALLREADVVTIHVSLNAATRGLIDARRLALLKPSAYLINTARGPIVDEAALVEALRHGRLAGAGLDVFDTEPLPAGHPLTTLRNVVLSAHIGWPTDDGYEKFAADACDVLLAFMEGREVPRFDADPSPA